MLASTSRSLCCLGVPIDFYWAYEPSHDPADHLQRAVDALMEAIAGDGRVWSTYKQTLDRRTFEKRLDKACRGELRQPEDTKALRGGLRNLHEIRWTGFDVANQNPDGTITYTQTDVRLITTQPEELTLGVVGLLAHEKPHTRQAKRIQNRAIDAAERCYDAGHSILWGLTPRSTT